MSLYSTNRYGFVEHLSQTCVVQHSVIKLIKLIAMNLATPKAGAKHELLYK
jgi:hypothetical protein